MSKIVIITGVSGCGKTTVGKALSTAMGWTFQDGDDYHPSENIEKMKAGIPLNDDDRKGWLLRLNELAQNSENVVIACSALKERYRHILAENLKEGSFHFVHLQGSYELISARIKERTGHFMPEKLLLSQFEDYENPSSGFILDIDHSVSSIVNQIKNLLEGKSEFGLIGLGVMGTSLARNLARNNVSLSIYNRHVSGVEENIAEERVSKYQELKEAKPFDKLQPFLDSLASPRKIMLMINAGSAVDSMLEELKPLLQAGDLVIDGGNSHYDDTQKRFDALKELGIKYLGSGVSGGEKGALLGPSIMPGGDPEGYSSVKHILERISAVSPEGGNCCDFIGEGGAGHFVKMVHNGIEYGEMQLIAECYQLLRRGCKKSPEDIAAIFSDWSQKGESSYLLDITTEILKTKDKNDELILDRILDKAGNKGTGSWTTIAASKLGVAIPTLTAALFARYQSAYKSDRVKLSELYVQEEGEIDLDPYKLRHLYALCRIVNHRQGIQLILSASDHHKWNIDIKRLLHVWSAGCIIRSQLLKKISTAYSDGDFIAHPTFVDTLTESFKSSKKVLPQIIISPLPSPCITTSLDYYKSMIQAEGSAQLIQAQRDFFGAHTFKLKSDPEGDSVHHNWEE